MHRLHCRGHGKEKAAAGEALRPSKDFTGPASSGRLVRAPGSVLTFSRTESQWEDGTMQRWCNTLLALGMLGTLAGPCSAQLLYDSGDLIATSSPYTGQDVPNGVLAVNPGTGDQHIVSSDGLIVSPLKLRIAPGGNIIVLDGGGGTTGGCPIEVFSGLENIWGPGPFQVNPGVIIRVDPTSGDQTAVTMGGFINDLTFGAIHVDSGGNIYVALGGGVGIIQVDPTTGDQTVISGGGNLVDPSGLASTPDGNLYVGDYTVMGGALFEVDVNTGTQTLIASGNLINGVVDIAVEPSGTVLVENQTNNIVRVDPSSGTQTLVASGLVGLNGITVGTNGQIYVSSDPGAGMASSIIQIDPVTGNQTVISTAGVFGFLGGLVQAP
jgi:hypothetical protein